MNIHIIWQGPQKDDIFCMFSFDSFAYYGISAYPRIDTYGFVIFCRSVSHQIYKILESYLSLFECTDGSYDYYKIVRYLMNIIRYSVLRLFL